MLALTGAIGTWLAIVVLGRDLLILAGAGVLYLAKSRTRFPPSPWGKISTFVQVLYLMFAMGALAGIPVVPAVVALQWVTAAAALVSLAAYARRVL